MNKRPTLGQWCTVAGRALKYRVTRDGSQPRYGSKDLNRDYPMETKWQGQSCAPVKAMFIGWRTMPIGVTEMEYESDDWKTWSYPVFTQTGVVEIWMFVTSERTNPFLAPPYYVTFEHDEHSALDALCYCAEPDGLDDRTWAIGMGGR